MCASFFRNAVVKSGYAIFIENISYLGFVNVCVLGFLDLNTDLGFADLLAGVLVEATVLSSMLQHE